MKEAVVPYIPGPTDWSRIPVLDIPESVRPSDAQVTARAQICYDDDALKLHLSATEHQIRREEHGPLGLPYQDSCLEFFICPMDGDLRYFNFEFSASGCLLLGFGSMEYRFRQVPSEEQKQELFAPVIQMRPDGWDLYFQIPCDFIRQYFPDFQAVSGKTVRANFYKCGDLTPKPHYLAWNMITRKGMHLFHTPAEFGRLVFE